MYLYAYVIKKMVVKMSKFCFAVISVIVFVCQRPLMANPVTFGENLHPETFTVK